MATHQQSAEGLSVGDFEGKAFLGTGNYEQIAPACANQLVFPAPDRDYL